jgi:hypothetical protein
MVQMNQWASQKGLSEAINFVMSDAFSTDYAEFDAAYPLGTRERMYVNQLLRFMNTLGSLYRHKLIHEELLFASYWTPVFWSRLEGVVAAIRTKFGEHHLYEQFEQLAQAQAQHASP